jgi:hypothetical protein
VSPLVAFPAAMVILFADFALGNRAHQSKCDVSGPVSNRLVGKGGSLGWMTLTSDSALLGRLPNMRLKLAGADRSNGSGVSCPWRGTGCVPHPCARGRVARRLSAIR